MNDNPLFVLTRPVVYEILARRFARPSCQSDETRRQFAHCGSPGGSSTSLTRGEPGGLFLETMARPKIVPKGSKFNRWETIGDPFSVPREGKKPVRKVKCRCTCGCGRTKNVPLYMLFNGSSKGCRESGNAAAGRKRSTHGMSRTSTYSSWEHMHARCKPSYYRSDRYFDKGIRVCERWSDFREFLEDMGEKPEGLTLDRIDNLKGYSPDNCRWASRKTQIHNRDMAVYVGFEGERVHLSDAANRLGVSYSRAYQMYLKGELPRYEHGN